MGSSALRQGQRSSQRERFEPTLIESANCIEATFSTSGIPVTFHSGLPLYIRSPSKSGYFGPLGALGPFDPLGPLGYFGPFLPSISATFSTFGYLPYRQPFLHPVTFHSGLPLYIRSPSISGYLGPLGPLGPRGYFSPFVYLPYRVTFHISYLFYIRLSSISATFSTSDYLP